MATYNIFGREITIGKSYVQPTVVDTPQVITSAKVIETEDKSILGGVLDFAVNKLSDEKRISKKLLQANKGWVYRNNDVIAKEVAGLEFELYSVGMKNGEITYREIDSHPLLEILSRFNDVTTVSDAIYVTASHKKLTGDAFWLIDGDNIFVLPPDKIELDIDDPTDGTATLVRGYVFKDVIDGEEVQHTYLPEQVIHFRTPNPNNMFRGIGAVEAAAETIDLDDITFDTTKKFFDQGAISNFVLSTENKLNQDQVTRLRAELKAAYSGTRNAYKTMILSGGLKPEKISFSNKEMEFLAQLEWYRDKIMVIFGNTKASLGLIDDVNRASYETSYIAWLRSTVRPEMQAIVNTLNEFLVPKYGKNLVLGFCDPVKEDRTVKVAEATQLIAQNIISINEARELLGYDPISGQDELRERQEQPQTEVPKSLQYINLKHFLRRSGVYDTIERYKDILPEARRIAKGMIKKEVTPTVEQREHTQFTNEQVETYWSKQIHIVDVLESRFQEKVERFIDHLEEITISKLDNMSKSAQKALYDEDALIVKATIDFEPILAEVALMAGQQAYALLDYDDTYMGFSVRDAIRDNIKKFAGSMIETDQELMTDIIVNGLKEGLSVPNIRLHIQDEFAKIKKVQAERIVRTEVIKTSNMAAVDAFKASGLVGAKQWYTALDDRVDVNLCAPMHGKIIGLEDNYFKLGDSFNGHVFKYDDVKEPPLHPNCRCTVLPVLLSEMERGFVPEKIYEREVLEQKIADLEAKIDKRTKAYRDLKQQRIDDAEYIKELEGLVNESESETETSTD